MSVVCGVEAIIYVHLLLLYLLIETSTRQYYVSTLPVHFKIQKTKLFVLITTLEPSSLVTVISMLLASVIIT